MNSAKILIFLGVSILVTPSVFSEKNSLESDSVANSLNEKKIPENSEDFSFISEVLSSVEENPLPSLIELLLDEDSQNNNKEIPVELSELVRGIYADATISEEIPHNVLSYLASIYGEHGYTEAGNWEVAKRIFNYKPYKGELPEFTTNDFYKPSDGKVTSRYGYRPKYDRVHKGIDLSINYGDTIRSALPGVVVGTGFDAIGYGNYIIVAHSGDIETLYGHLQSILSVPGEKVEAGDAIGIGGSTGNSTGPHLHFETRIRGEAIDPSAWLNFQK